MAGRSTSVSPDDETRERIVEREEGYVQAVRDGISSLELGEGIPHVAVMAEMDAYIDDLERRRDSKAR